MAKDSQGGRTKIITRREVTLNVPIVKVPKVMSPLQGFVDFVREQGVIGLAVGFVLGVAAKGVVDAIVNNGINPIVGLYGDGGTLADKFWCMKSVAGECTNKLGYGAIVNQLINFLIVAAVIYFIIKMLKLEKIDKKKA